MVTEDPPTLPTDPAVVELDGNVTARGCECCGEDAEFYAFVTNGAANARLGTDLGAGEWPVNTFLCSDCFGAAPRVDSWDELVEA